MKSVYRIMWYFYYLITLSAAYWYVRRRNRGDCLSVTRCRCWLTMIRTSLQRAPEPVHHVTSRTNTTQTRQWCIVGFAPGTRCTMDPSIVSAPAIQSSSTRCNQYDAARVLSCTRKCNDSTRCNGIDMPPYGPLGNYVQIWHKYEVAVNQVLPRVGC